MAEVIGWHGSGGDVYAENVEVTQVIGVRLDGWTYGIATKRMQIEVRVGCKMARGVTPSKAELDAMILSSPQPSIGAGAGDLKIPLRGIGGEPYRIYPPFHSSKKGGVYGDLPSEKWVLKGDNFFFDGYEDEMLGITQWSATFISAAVRVVRGYWTGAMNVANFDALWQRTT